MIRNMGTILNAFTSEILENQFQNKPAIVIAGGPSLDKNIHLLKELEDKALLLATDTAAMALYKRGIKPHLIFSVDPQYAAYQKLYENMPDDAYDDIPMMCFTISVHQLLNKHKGKKILTQCNEGVTEQIWERVGKKFAFIKYYSSVSCLAFAAADFFGCSEIVFVGQDLAYTGNKMHATGARVDGEVISSERVLCYVGKDLYGNDLLMHPRFDTCRVWLEDEIALRVVERDVEFIDATEGGAYIEGTKVMTLREVIDKYCTKTYDFYGKLCDVLHEKELLSLEQKRSILHTYRNIHKDLQTMESLVDTGKEQVRRIRKMYDFGQLPKERDEQRALEKLQSIINEIDSFNDALLFIYLSYKKRESDLEKTEREFGDATQKEKTLNVAEEGEKIFCALEETIKVVLPILSEELDKLEKIYCE